MMSVMEAVSVEAWAVELFMVSAMTFYCSWPVGRNKDVFWPKPVSV